eukprot:109550-Chlamydomonas_euryale.AAC.1
MLCNPFHCVCVSYCGAVARGRAQKLPSAHLPRRHRLEAKLPPAAILHPGELHIQAQQHSRRSWPLALACIASSVPTAWPSNPHLSPCIKAHNVHTNCDGPTDRNSGPQHGPSRPEMMAQT